MFWDEANRALFYEELASNQIVILQHVLRQVIGSTYKVKYLSRIETNYCTLNFIYLSISLVESMSPKENCNKYSTGNFIQIIEQV